MASPDVSRIAAVASPWLRLAAKIALVIEVGCIAWLASFGHVHQIQVQSFFMFNDKVAHMLAFLVAGMTASLASRSLIWSALALSAGAGGVEFMQTFVPGRTASILDFAASVTGVAGGLALGAAFWPALLKRLNRVTST